ncbi:hypothetical protein [Bowmanella dokdonensis]|nr:hypothetical protein [Bowmanella dokdonensis]
MKNELDSRFILSVFETIRTRGKAEDNAYLWEPPEIRSSGVTTA